MAQYLLVFLAGLAGSLHCVGMCGGFACALGSDPRGRAATLRRQLLYNVGRVTTYMFLGALAGTLGRSEEHTSELQSLMRISYALFCLTTKKHSRTRSSH